MIASVILAAGPGSRLGELGARLPKALIRVGGRANLERLAAQHLDAGLCPVMVAVHHLSGMIRDHFGRDAARWADVRFVFTGQRGTGADLLECLPHVTADAFVVCNGDTVVDLDLAALLAYASEDRERGVIVQTRRVGVPNEGAFYVGGNDLVLASLEAVPRQAVPEGFAWRGSSTGAADHQRRRHGPANPRPGRPGVDADRLNSLRRGHRLGSGRIRPRRLREQRDRRPAVGCRRCPLKAASNWRSRCPTSV